jgi:hypothetical protein
MHELSVISSKEIESFGGSENMFTNADGLRTVCSRHACN